MSERAIFLETIRRQLALDRHLGETALPPIATRATTGGDRVEQFQTQARAAGAICDTVVRADDVPDVLRRMLRDRSPRRVAISDTPLLTEFARQSTSGIEILHPNENKHDIFQAEIGITSAQWGLAETGTLVLESSVEKNRLASLVPPVHIALLPTANILGTMDELFRRRPAASNQAVTFITGPSRTADIELTLVVGVHGPEEVNIILIQDA